MGEWIAILSGEVAERAEHAVLVIAQEMRGRGPGNGEPSATTASLAQGTAGQAVFFHQLAATLGGQRESAVAEALLESAVATMASVPMSASLYQGFTGIAWAVEHLESASADGDRNAEIDALLLDLVSRRPWPTTLDLVDGLMGIAVYALERLRGPAAAALIAAIVEHLQEAAEAVPGGLTWKFRPPRDEGSWPLHDFGLAHGVAGILTVLAALHAAARPPSAAAELLERGVSWLLAQEVAVTAPDRLSRFPGLLYADRPAAPSRLAWCYGDLAVAVAVFAAAQACERDDWQRRALDIAAQAARRSFSSSKVKDTGLCHGAFGVAHLFNRLGQASGDERLTDAALRWYREGFALYRPGEALAGFPAWWVERAGTGRWAPDASLLTGAAGTALALLAGLTSAEPAWDRLLLLSRTPGTSPLVR